MWGTCAAALFNNTIASATKSTQTMKTPVYCAFIEIEPLQDCELDPEEIAGAFVRCYIPAKVEKTAMTRLRAELKVMNMKLVDTEFCVDYDKTEWENPKDFADDQYVKEARTTKTVIFATFHTWGHDGVDK